MHTTTGRNGSLDAYRTTCEKCGLETATPTVLGVATHYLAVEEHIAYHAKKEAASE
jgi:hypothetical protein